MLVLRRKNLQWIRIVHSKTGEELRIRVQDLGTAHGSVSLVIDDNPRNFEIYREESNTKKKVKAQDESESQPGVSGSSE